MKAIKVKPCNPSDLLFIFNWFQLMVYLVADDLVDPESFPDGRVPAADVGRGKGVAVAILHGRLVASRKRYRHL